MPDQSPGLANGALYPGRFVWTDQSHSHLICHPHVHTSVSAYMTEPLSSRHLQSQAPPCSPANAVHRVVCGVVNYAVYYAVLCPVCHALCRALTHITYTSCPADHPYHPDPTGILMCGLWHTQYAHLHPSRSSHARCMPRPPQESVQ